jgi:hypothetical protein
MSTTDQPAPDERTANEKATEVVAEFANIPSAYRDNPIAVATRQGLLVLNERVHALESVEVVTLEATGCAGCARGLLPEAGTLGMSDGVALEHGYHRTQPFSYGRRSTPEENARADARAEQLQARAAELTGEPALSVPAMQVTALLAGQQLSRDDARAIHDAVNARTAGTAKQKLTERIEELELAVANWKRREDAAVNAWGEMKREKETLVEELGAQASRAASWQERAEAAERDAEQQRQKQAALVHQHGIEYEAAHALARQHHEDAIRYREERDGARAEATRWEQSASNEFQTGEESARSASYWRRRAVRAEHAREELLQRLVDEQLVKDEDTTPADEQPAVPKTDPDVVAARFDEARRIPAVLAEEIIASSPHPADQEVAAEKLDHDPQIPEAIAAPRDLPVRPLQAQIDNAIADTAGGVAALLAHFGINTGAPAPAKRLRAPFAFTERPDDGLDPREETPSERMNRVMGEAIGAASTCWPNMTGTGIFDEARAREILEALRGEVEAFLLHDRQAQRGTGGMAF